MFFPPGIQKDYVNYAVSEKEDGVSGVMTLTRMTAVLGCIWLYWTVLGCTRRYGTIMDQSSYLSQISQIIFVEKKWSFGENLGKFGKIWEILEKF